MGIEHLKWWHWSLISLVVGAMLGWTNSGVVDSGMRNHEDQIPFERAMLHAPVFDGKQSRPWVTGVTVYPVTTIKGPDGNPVRVTPVTYDVVAPVVGGKPGEVAYRPSWFAAPVPYVPTNQPVVYDKNDTGAAAKDQAANGGQLPPGIDKTFTPAAADTLGSITKAAYGKDTLAGEEAITKANERLFRRQHAIQALIDQKRFALGNSIFIPWNPDPPRTARDWLTAAAARHAWVRSRYAWWKLPAASYALWVGGSFAVVGLAWPAMQHVMVNAGLGKKAPEKKYDLSRYGKKRSEPAPQPALAAAMAESDADRMRAIEAAVAASLRRADEEDRQKADAEDEEDEPAPVRRLSNRPMKPTAPVAKEIAEGEENLEYRPDMFYPVVRPVVHQVEKPKAESRKTDA